MSNCVLFLAKWGLVPVTNGFQAQLPRPNDRIIILRNHPSAVHTATIRLQKRGGQPCRSAGNVGRRDGRFPGRQRSGRRARRVRQSSRQLEQHDGFYLQRQVGTSLWVDWIGLPQRLLSPSVHHAGL